MKITIQKTLYLEEVPEEIDSELGTISNRLIGAKQILESVRDDSLKGMYISASENIEILRSVLAVIDQNLEEQQSLFLSYEKIRIASQFPPSEVEDEQ